jgi:glycosyltransferase involved in cell wall biosynthesis
MVMDVTILVVIVDEYLQDCCDSIKRFYPNIQVVSAHKDKIREVSSSIATKYTIIVDSGSIFDDRTKIDLLINGLDDGKDIYGGIISDKIGMGNIFLGHINNSGNLFSDYDGNSTDLVHAFYAIKTDLLKDREVEETFSFLEEHLNFLINMKKQSVLVGWTHQCVLSHKPFSKSEFGRSNRTYFTHIIEKTGLNFVPIPIHILSIDEFGERPDTGHGKCPISVVIPCHNYGRFLRECLISIKSQYYTPAEIIVIDDSSSEDIETICKEFDDIRFYRHEFGDVHQVRKAGLSYSTQKYICFLDADDKIPKEYFRESIRLFDEDYRTVITFPHLEYFGDRNGPAHGMEKSPDTVLSDDMEERNWVPSGSIFKKKILEESGAFKKHIDPKKSWAQDWIIGREVLRSGPWVAKKMKCPLLYRSHDTNMSSVDAYNYWEEANLVNDTVTLVIALSGRQWAWPPMKEWLMNQSWPISQLRVMILDNSHTGISLLDLGLADWPGSIQIERCDIGRLGLAEENRVHSTDIQMEVNSIVAQLYNIAVSISRNEYMFFLEDDVIPMGKNTIRDLMGLMSADIVSVSGVYPTRYDSSKACAWSSFNNGEWDFLPVDGVGTREICGSGFGCLIARRSLLKKNPLFGHDTWYDHDFFGKCVKYRKLINYHVVCDHLVNR